MEIPRHWRLKQQRYSLVGQECSSCDAKLFPPRAVCPNCSGEVQIDTGGTIFEVEKSTISLSMEASMSSK